MQLVRFRLSGQTPRLGLLDGHQVRDLTARGLPELASLSAAVRASSERPIADLVQQADLPTLPTYALDEPSTAGLQFLPPVDGQEVWAAGVTYAWSREARVREAIAKDIYVRVYEAERPELFFKSTPDKVVGPGDWVGIRGDSHWNVPEPELTVLYNAKLQVIGFTVGNDMSSRDIEGANPLYLPQAKVYRHSCALGPALTLAEPGLDPTTLDVALEIRRGDVIAYAGATNTRNIHRDLSELGRWLGAYNDFPEGVWLMTGTGVVPGDDFTLQDGDVVVITIAGVGTLSNSVHAM